MANILLTNRCNQKCSYCFAKSEMEKKNKEMSFSDFEKVLDFLGGSREKKVRLMGGEPTLHPKFKEIVEASLKRGFSVQIFTNGIFDKNILDFLLSKDSRIRYSFNINPKEKYSSKIWNQVLKNLEKISVFKNTLVGAVVFDDKFESDYLIKIAKRFGIKNIVLRLANPNFSVNSEKLINEIQKIKRENIGVGLGCGLSKDVFNKKGIKYGCEGNSGKFDIGTDLSVFRCLPLASWHRKKLGDFKNCREIEKYFNSLLYKTEEKDCLIEGPCIAKFLKNKNG